MLGNMVIFYSIRFKNFLSYPNTVTEFELNNNLINLIFGKNGCGKSSILDAVFYAIYGKPLLNGVILSDLVSRVNKKNMEVVLEFSVVTNDIKKDVYKVIRGMKPNTFEIYKNGTLIPKPADNKDYQKQLTEIIGISDKSFKQLVFISLNNYVPYSTLGKEQKRKYIEDVLDLTIYAKMNERLKETKKSISSQYETAVANFNAKSDSLKFAQEQYDSEEKRINDMIIQYTNEIDKMLDENKTLESVISETSEEINALISRKIEIESKKKALEAKERIAEINKDYEDQKTIVKENQEFVSSKSSEIQRYEKIIETGNKIMLISELTETINRNNTVISELEKKNTAFVDENSELEKKNVDIAGSIQKGNGMIESVKTTLASLIKTRDDEKARILKEINTAEMHSASAVNDLNFFESNDNCPTCLQTIDPIYKETKMTELKKIIEDMKATIDSNKTELNTVLDNTEITKNNEQLVKFQSYLEKYQLERNTNTNKISSNTQQMSANVSTITRLQSENDSIRVRISEQQVTDTITKEELETIKRTHSDLKEKIATANAVIHEKNNLLMRFELERTKLSSLVVDVSESLSELLSEETSVVSKATELQTVISNQKEIIVRNSTMISEKEKFINVTSKESLVSFKNRIEEIERDISACKEIIDANKQKVELYEQLLTILSDTGLKLLVVKQYLPFFNKYINEYCELLNFPHKARMTEEFEIEITDFRKQEVNYYRMSNGEKQRLDIVFIFVFLNILRLKSKNNFNLLCFDEILDSSLDEEGITNLHTIFRALKDKGYTITLISHNEEHKSKADKLFQVTKGTFSTLSK